VTIFERSGKRLVRTSPHRAGLVLDMANTVFYGKPRTLHARGAGFHGGKRRHTLNCHHPHAGPLHLADGDSAIHAAASRPFGCTCSKAARRKSHSGCSRAWPMSASPPKRWTSTAELLTLPCYQWSHLVVAPKGHPLVCAKPARRAHAGHARHLPADYLRPHLHRPLAYRSRVR
jgi:hypothetical protein